MIGLLITVLIILSIFTALGIACAVWIGRTPRRAVDPFFHPFGEVPRLDRARLHQHRSGRTALQPDAGGGRNSFPSLPAAARTRHSGGRHVAAS